MPTEKIAKKYKIGHVEFNLKVAEDEQAMYDRAANNANNIIDGWREKFAKQSTDYQYAMSILELALQLEKAKETQRNNNNVVNNTCNVIAEFLKQYEN